MMDLATLAGAAVTMATPYLAKAVDGATEKLGEDALDAAGKLAAWLRAKLTPAGTQALAALARQPSSPVKQEIVKLHIQEMLDDNPQLVAELRAMVTSEAAREITQTQTVTGPNSKAVQAAGNNNNINIG